MDFIRADRILKKVPFIFLEELPFNFIHCRYILNFYFALMKAIIQLPKKMIFFKNNVFLFFLIWSKAPQKFD